MPEDEFEIYLTLLAKTLRLSDAQRDAIAAELRDHMENRLRDLTLQGIEREQAIETALAEFGDASALAKTFSTHQHKRKRVMKSSIGTLAAACAIALGFSYLLPTDRVMVPEQNHARAQEGAEALPAPEPLERETHQIRYEMRLLEMPEQAYQHWLEKQGKEQPHALGLMTVDDKALKELIRLEGVESIAAPRVVAWNRQEAALLIGTQTPIKDGDHGYTIGEGIRMVVLGNCLTEEKVALCLDIQTRWSADHKADHPDTTPQGLPMPGLGAWRPQVSGMRIDVELISDQACLIPAPLEAGLFLHQVHKKSAPKEGRITMLYLKAASFESEKS